MQIQKTKAEKALEKIAPPKPLQDSWWDQHRRQFWYCFDIAVLVATTIFLFVSFLYLKQNHDITRKTLTYHE